MGDRRAFPCRRITNRNIDLRAAGEADAVRLALEMMTTAEAYDHPEEDRSHA